MILHSIGIDRALFLGLMIVLFQCISGCVTRVASLSEDKDQNLKNKYGYLLMAVDTNQQLHEIYIDGFENFILTEKNLSPGSNYIIFKVPADDYTISKISMNNFFGYKLLGDWSFSVESGVISYVGHLKVKARAWWWQPPSFELVNQSSEALEFLEQKFPELLSARALRYLGPGEDDFFSVIGKFSVNPSDTLISESQDSRDGGVQ